MSTRDKVLPKFDKARTKIASLGLRRFTVTLRRRVWSGTRIGEGTPVNQDLVLTPTPRVRFKSPFAAQMSGVLMSGGSVRDRFYEIDKITPAYVDSLGNPGGYTTTQLRMRVGADLKNVECVVVLVGDDGMARECSQLILEDDRSFGYSMTVQEMDKASTSLVTISIQPATVSLAAGDTLQMVAMGHFNDGSIYDITCLCSWKMPGYAIATVDVLGVVRAHGPGSAQLTAQMGGIVTPPRIVTVT
jgi:hypothetical protein